MSIGVKKSLVGHIWPDSACDVHNLMCFNDLIAFWGSIRLRAGWLAPHRDPPFSSNFHPFSLRRSSAGGCKRAAGGWIFGHELAT